MSKAKDLSELLQRSPSTREYFCQLSVDLQLKLHEQNDFIYTAEMLHRQAQIIGKNFRI